ncbi:MAG: Rrf2 family transcriptional regulator [Chloroflexi bacterium]|nr:Rrf2 family transcriptional regulator [Chloroflexota bacterium]
MLDLARFIGQGPVQSHDIAVRQDIPEPYLNQLLTLLRKAGLINSRRGPGGGHALARPPSEINLGEVVLALEGPVLASLEPSSEGARRSTCFALRQVMQEVDDVAQQVLARVSLADLLDRERRRTFNYYI